MGPAAITGPPDAWVMFADDVNILAKARKLGNDVRGTLMDALRQALISAVVAVFLRSLLAD